MKNERGFTLIEMLIVLLVISVLLIITIPNVARHQTTIDDKGCEAYVKMVVAQAQAYYLETGNKPKNIGELEDAKYLVKDQDACAEEKPIIVNGEVNHSSLVTSEDEE